MSASHHAIRPPAQAPSITVLSWFSSISSIVARLRFDVTPRSKSTVHDSKDDLFTPAWRRLGRMRRRSSAASSSARARRVRPTRARTSTTGTHDRALDDVVRRAPARRAARTRDGDGDDGAKNYPIARRRARRRAQCDDAMRSRARCARLRKRWTTTRARGRERTAR